MSEIIHKSEENSAESTSNPGRWKGRHLLTPKEKKNAIVAITLAALGIIGFLTQLFYFLIYRSIDDWLAVLTYWIVLIMPGYLTNAGMLIWGGGKPLDRGKYAKDGRRLFGPGKTIRGFFLGPLAFGIPIALIIHGILYFSWDNISLQVTEYLSDPNVRYTFYEGNSAQLWEDLGLFLLGSNNLNLFPLNLWTLLLRIIGCSFGAAFGDLAGSWLKRRKQLPRGEPFWGVDQLDFLVGCLVLSFLPLILGGFHWTIVSSHVLIMLIIITPSITVIANTISFLLGRKKVPW